MTYKTSKTDTYAVGQTTYLADLGPTANAYGLNPVAILARYLAIRKQYLAWKNVSSGYLLFLTQGQSAKIGSAIKSEYANKKFSEILKAK